MRPVVVRLPDEDLSRLRILANTCGRTISALLRDILTAYCQQLRENAR
jgi:predicted DNA-binding protein